jgi:type II secretory pathway pseudopilin PulG
MKGGTWPHGFRLASRKSHGFTIIETILVLTVSSGLLVAAATIINGRQAATQFSQGIQQVAAELQQNMNDVSNGYYKNDGSIQCTQGIGGPILKTVATNQGTNKDCVYLGKVLQFAVGTSTDTYNSYTVVGLSSGITTLASAKPRLVAQTTAEAAAPPPQVPDVFEAHTMPFGLTAINMYYGTNPAANIVGAVGFIAHVGSAGTTGQVDVAAIPGTLLGMQKGAAVAAINTHLSTLPVAAVNPSGGVHICLQSGGTKQSALLTIGGGGKQLTVDFSVKSNQVCS